MLWNIYEEYPFIYVFYVVIIILLLVLIRNIKDDENEHFTSSSVPKVVELISSYWNKYMHFVNKRSKCIDCDNSSSMDHPYREEQLSRS